MNLSPQQDTAAKMVSKWMRSKDSQIFRLFGYAGTGKTTIAKLLAQDAHEPVFCAFTGKASLVMKKNGCKGAKTIHSLIYKVEQDEVTGITEFKLNKTSKIRKSGLIIVDECSMVNKELAKDLMSYGVKILVLGDPAQLPPVNGGGYFTDVEPDMMLTEIHRQAADNPIVRLATDVRQGNKIEVGTYGESRVVTRGLLKHEPNLFRDADQVLVGRNVTRRQFNERLRDLAGFGGPSPEIGDRLVCLKNDGDKKLLNGGLWTVADTFSSRKGSKFVNLSVTSEDFESPHPIKVKVHKELFADNPKELDWKELKGSQEFDYGYALTVHKSQGSQWDNVALMDESYCFKENKNRWLYTGITRAAERLTVCL